jgi:hypothetical protein
MPKLPRRKFLSVMVILREAASRKNQRTVVRHLQSPLPTATIAPQPQHASRPIPLRTQPGRCKVRFAMYRDPAVTLTRPVPMLKLDWTSLLLLKRTTAIAAQATAASQMPDPLKASHKMSHIGRVRVQVPWALLGRQVLHFSSSIPAQLQYCDHPLPDLLHLSV